MRSGVMWGTALVCCVLTGCSFAFVRPSPRIDPVTKTARCIPRVLPAFDLLMVPAMGIASLAQLFGAAYGGCDGQDADACTHAAARNAAILGGVGVAFLASGIYGMIASSKCFDSLPPNPTPPQAGEDAESD